MKTVFVVLFKSFYKYEGTEYPNTPSVYDIQVYENLTVALDHVCNSAKFFQSKGYERLPYWHDESKPYYWGSQRVENKGTAAVWEIMELTAI